MLIISNLNRKEGYTREDGWELKTCTRSLKMKHDDRHPVIHTVKFLIHTKTEISPQTGNEFTSKYKAWNEHTLFAWQR